MIAKPIILQQQPTVAAPAARPDRPREIDKAALEMGIINKAFDPFERQLTADVVWARVPRTAKADEFFGD